MYWCYIERERKRERVTERPYEGRKRENEKIKEGRRGIFVATYTYVYTRAKPRRDVKHARAHPRITHIHIYTKKREREK